MNLSSTAQAILWTAGILTLGGVALAWIGLARKNRALVVTGTLLLFAGGGTVLAWAIVEGAGARAAAVGLTAALLPAPILVGAFLWLGRYRRRPWLVLAFCFGWGACVSTAISLAVNTGAAYLLEKNGYDQNLAAVVSAPVIEEIAKLLGPLLVYWFARRHLTGTLDALVYCGLAGAGFAVSENVLYASGAYLYGAESLDAAAGIAQVTLLVVVRGLATMFAHPLMTGLSAIGLGKAARRPGRKGVQTVWIIGMLLCGMALHALWNGSSVLGVNLDMPALWFALYPAFLAPLFFTMVGAALWLRAADARRTERMLAPLCAAGQVSPPELASLATFSRRASARAWARRYAGPHGERAMKDFQRAASDIAEEYDLAGIGRPWDERAVEHAVHRISAARAVYTGVDPYTPPALWDGRRYHITFPDGQMRPVEAPAQPVMPLPMAPPSAYPVTYA
ncbi:PrsW family intramembrane metalloprotease [Glycomyces sp. TRM65418]|uniref:PrsW family intramembrane metalloprotease n=1 Tax=Glycomyces sp. TRM65418 TaxID=2867006 RepID=UPI001CE60939|nr:PrsW family intramembrane metalloprotease [Glycomyces sp. TRM65418]MCC3764639.1 PrsW family intramembrane metalloprotease [Glycomyces sp. TRM65418]QZD54301.1 PrsW family intramembrane metalloprotease [Glycomyces sp. TRM65418]